MCLRLYIDSDFPYHLRLYPRQCKSQRKRFWLKKVRRFPTELEDYCFAAASGQLPLNRISGASRELHSKANAFAWETTKPLQWAETSPPSRAETGEAAQRIRDERVLCIAQPWSADASCLLSPTCLSSAGPPIVYTGFLDAEYCAAHQATGHASSVCVMQGNWSCTFHSIDESQTYIAWKCTGLISVVFFYGSIFYSYTSWCWTLRKRELHVRKWLQDLQHVDADAVSLPIRVLQSNLCCCNKDLWCSFRHFN